MGVAAATTEGGPLEQGAPPVGAIGVDQKPGRNIKGTHKADAAPHHRTGERKVNPAEEHSIKPKGPVGIVR